MAFATSVLLYLHRYVFGFLKPTLSKDWGLSATELGELDSAFSICYTVFQFPLAVAADAFGVHVVLTTLMVIWLGGMGLMAWAPSARMFWYAQALLGTGQSAVYPCLSRIGRYWFPPNVRTTLQGTVGVLAGRLGALGASLLFGSLLLGIFNLDWRTSTWILVALGVVHLLWFAIVFRDLPRKHPSVNEAEARMIEGDESSVAGSTLPPMARITTGQLLRTMSPRSLINLICLSMQSLLSTFADNIYSNWMPLFLAQVHHVDFKTMGIYSAMPLLGGAIAGLLGGYLNDHFIARTGNRRWSRVGVAFAGKGAAALLMLAALLVYDRPYLFCVVLFFVKLFGDWSLATSWGVVTDIGGRASASVFAFNNSVASIGSIAAPIAFGHIADHYGWKNVFATVAATYLLCALSWLAIDCTIPVLGNSQDEDHTA
jgi:ACS family glucarate transporter-like MFS transporter